MFPQSHTAEYTMNFMATTEQRQNRSPLLFARIESRLGLIKPPNGETEENRGVEFGSHALLSDQFLCQYPHAQVLDISFPAPEDVSPSSYFDVLAQAYLQAMKTISDELTPKTTLVCVGGDHSVALASVASILSLHHPKKVAIIMIDSHADIHQPSTSPSGNFHGMWLRPVIDHFENPAIDALVPTKSSPSQLIYIGNLDIEQAERDFIHAHAIQVFDRHAATQPALMALIDQLLLTMDHIHISLDIDVFSHQHAPATGMHIAHGLAPSDVLPILEKIRRANSLSLDLVEVNPTMTGSEKTIELAQKLLFTTLSH